MSRRLRICRRRGSIYAAVTGVALLLMVIGMGLLTSAQSRLRTMGLERDWDEAAWLAASAVERACALVNDQLAWRYVYRDLEETFTPPTPLGRGEIRWMLDDQQDNDLNDSQADAVRIHGFARVGNSVRAYSVMAWPTGAALDVLRTAVHAGGQLKLRSGQTLSASGGPASANADLDVADGLLLGSAEAASVDAPANVTGAVLAPAPAKIMPATSLYDLYQLTAEEIKYSDLDDALGANYFQGKLQKAIISPAHHPTQHDKANPNGMYWIKVPTGVRLDITNCRIKGTLLVKLDPAAQLRVDGGVVWEPARRDLPALIVYTTDDSNTAVELRCTGALDESSAGINANPGDFGYFGDSDADMDDVYPASLQGLFHVIRKTAAPPSSVTTVRADNRITGCIIADGDIQIDGASSITADARLMSNPPLGYTTSGLHAGLIRNADIEDGLTGWFVADGVSTLEDSSDGISGKCLRTRSRSVASSGPSQDVTARVSSGTTYRSELWVRMKDQPEDINIIMHVNSTNEGDQFFGGTVQNVGTNWTKIASTMTPTWSGTLGFVRWIVNTTSSTQEFYIDTVLVIEIDALDDLSSNVQLLPWTWQAEAAPDGI